MSTTLTIFLLYYVPIAMIVGWIYFYAATNIFTKHRGLLVFLGGVFAPIWIPIRILLKLLL